MGFVIAQNYQNFSSWFLTNFSAKNCTHCLYTKLRSLCSLHQEDFPACVFALMWEVMWKEFWVVFSSKAAKHIRTCYRDVSVCFLLLCTMQQEQKKRVTCRQLKSLALVTDVGCGDSSALPGTVLMNLNQPFISCCSISKDVEPQSSAQNHELFCQTVKWTYHEY
jgi:hypothetical protein